MVQVDYCYNYILDIFVSYFDKNSNLGGNFLDVEYLRNSNFNLYDVTQDFFNKMEAESSSNDKIEFDIIQLLEGKKYLQILIEHVNLNLDFKSIETFFIKEYQEHLNNILNSHYKNWADIEKNLRYWQDAIRDKDLEQSILILKFIYVYKKAGDCLDLQMPDKISKLINEILAIQA